MSVKKPLFSIITISYNAQETIETTMRSVVSQDFDDYEYFIIDGASQDDTLERVNRIVQGAKDLNIQVFSEPDEGIADAFNKGLQKAKGEYILFLNSGDYFLSTTSLSLVARYIESGKKEDVITFSSEIDGKGKSPVDFEAGMKAWETSLLPHQSTFVRREVFVENKVGAFDKRYKQRMDYDFFVRCKKQGCTYACVPETIVFYDMKGLSAMYPRDGWAEGLAIKLLYGLNIDARDVDFFERLADMTNPLSDEIGRWIKDNPLKDGNKYIIYGAGIRGKQICRMLIEEGVDTVSIVDTYKAGSIDEELGVPILSMDDCLSKDNKWIISVQNNLIFANIYSELLCKGVSMEDIFLYDEMTLQIKPVRKINE